MFNGNFGLESFMGVFSFIRNLNFSWSFLTGLVDNARTRSSYRIRNCYAGDVSFFMQKFSGDHLFTNNRQILAIKCEKSKFDNLREVYRKTPSILREFGNGYRDIFSLSWAKRYSSQYLLLWTYILQKSVFGYPWEINRKHCSWRVVNS